ncbi:MAG: DUF805 domain-containing protein [Flavobacteriaceae bacterium]
MKSAVTTVYTNYFGFTGRAARSEFWYFILFVIVIGVVLNIIDSAIFGMGMGGVGILGGIFSLASLIPEIAVAIRRLHDSGRTGWWLLLVLIPLIGWLVLIYFYVQPSQPGANQYGPNPYGE